MFQKLEDLFKNRLRIEEQTSSEDVERKLMIATTVLFLEIAYADFKITEEEEAHVRQTLCDFFDLNESEVDELIALARRDRSRRQDIWKFTNLLKEHFDHAQKVRILEKLWAVIYADGTVDKYEDSMIRKVTNLLGLEHGDMIRAKIKTQPN